MIPGPRRRARASASPTVHGGYQAFSRSATGLSESITGADRVAELARDIIPPTEAREWCVCFYLNSRNAVLRSEVVSVGTLNASLIHPREVFAPAIEARAAAVIMVHNHPSGDPSPSTEDQSITRRLHECGRILGIELLDHVVVGANGAFTSLRSLGPMG